MTGSDRRPPVWPEGGKSAKIIELHPHVVPIPTPQSVAYVAQQSLYTRLCGYFTELAQTPLEELRENSYSQARAWNELIRYWGKLDAPQQQQLQLMCQHSVLYLRNHPHPDEAFAQVLDLGSVSRAPVEDVNRICKVRDVRQEEYKLVPGEEVYLEIQGWLRDFIDLFKWTQAHLGFDMWAGVTCIAGAAKWNYYIDREAYKLRLQFYTILSGESSSGKSQAWSACNETLHRLNDLTFDPNKDVDYRKVRILAEDSTKAGMIKMMVPLLDTHASPTEGDKNRIEQIPVSSSSVLLLDELATFLGRDAYEVEAKIPFLTEIAEKGYLRKMTAKDGLMHIQDCSLNMLACCAPAWIQAVALTPMTSQGGFMDRTIIVHRDVNRERRFATPYAVDPLQVLSLARRLLKISSQREPVELGATRECKRFYEEWYYSLPIKSIEHDDPNIHVTTPNRRANQAWKLAGVLALSEEQTWIERRHLDLAIRLLEIELKATEGFHKAITASPHRDRILFIIRFLARSKGETQKGELTRRVLTSARFRGGRHELDETVRAMLDARLLVRFRRKGVSTTYFRLTVEGLREAEEQGFPVTEGMQAKAAAADALAIVGDTQGGQPHSPESPT